MLSEKSGMNNAETKSEHGAQKSIDQRKSGGSLHSKTGSLHKPASSGLHAVRTVAFGKEQEIQTDLLMIDMNRSQQ